MSGICPYCKKPFKPGETLTSNENEDIVHLDCEMEFDKPDICRECGAKCTKTERRICLAELDGDA